MGCEESYCMKTLPGHGGRAKAGSLLKNQPRKKKTRSPQSQNNLEDSSYCLAEQDNYLIQTALLNHSLLFKARGYANREIINRLESFKARTGQVIFQKGDPSHYFYIIVKGSVRISDWAEGQPCKILKRGDCFGDLGIYNKTTRSATATALQDCEFVGLQSQNFLRISLDLSKRAQNDVFKEIKSVTIFKNLSTYQKHKLSFLAQELKFKKDAVVFKKGEASSCLYVIKQGRVRLSVPGKDPIEIKAKQSFGQSCLNGNNPERIADAICLQSTILLAFSRADIEKYLDRELFDLQTINKLIWAFKHNKNLRVSQIVLESMIQNRELHYFTNNEIIAQKGDPITHLVVSLEGGINNGLELEVLNTDYLIDIKHHTKDLRKTGGSGDVAFISIEDLQKTFHRSFSNLIDLNQNIWKQIQSISKIQEYVKTLSPNEFYVVQNKGNSDIGCTLKIKTESNIQFALRIFDKSKTIRQKDEQLVVNLGDLANKLYHNLIAKQYRVYSDKCRVYIMSKWVEGEDLFDLLAKTKKLSVIVVKHFAACVINIMQYLHHRRIIWRQLKVQSFVVDTSGYLNLVDLMYVQQLPEEQSFLSNTRKATFYYLAPEILSNQGYGFQTDFWSLGVLLYRMLVGQFPYGATISTCQDSILEQLLEQIKTKPLYLPSWLTSDVKMLLKLLLNPSPLERGLISFSKLKNSTIFKDYDWLGLIERKVKNVPYVPKKVVQKLPDPIRFHYWLQNVYSELPPSSILDQLEPKPKTAKK